MLWPRIRPVLLALSLLGSSAALASGLAFAEASAEPQQAQARRPAAEFGLPDDGTPRFTIGLRYYRGFAITPISLSGITCRLERAAFSAEVECQRAEHLIDLAYNQEALARRHAAEQQREPH